MGQEQSSSFGRYPLCDNLSGGAVEQRFHRQLKGDIIMIDYFILICILVEGDLQNKVGSHHPRDISIFVFFSMDVRKPKDGFQAV